MDWMSLLSEEVVSHARTSDDRDPRNNFEKDWDRIVFSAPFRRLQDKTQVIPLPQQDFVHTRLTHSLETSAVGRSLGLRVSKRLEARQPALASCFEKIPAILTAACLAHDIGNPPFGHSGESAIGAFFARPAGASCLDILSKEQQHDLSEFEGNANGFHLLHALPQLNLTCAVLAAFTKYPVGAEGMGNKADVKFKKAGLFQCDIETYGRIAEKLGIPRCGKGWHRHPLAFLAEAADDICYRIVDFEDGLKMRLISYDDFQGCLLKIFHDEKRDNVKAKLNKSNWNENEKASFLRTAAIGELIDAVVAEFDDSHDRILVGEHSGQLIDGIKEDTKMAIDEIQSITKSKVYRWDKVLQIEAAGFEVLGGLLGTFIGALAHFDIRTGKPVAEHLVATASNPLRTEREKLLRLLPSQFLPKFLVSRKPDDWFEVWKTKEWLDAWGRDPAVRYDALLSACKFVAGMTDSYAINLFKRLKGIELPA